MATWTVDLKGVTIRLDEQEKLRVEQGATTIGDLVDSVPGPVQAATQIISASISLEKALVDSADQGNGACLFRSLIATLGLGAWLVIVPSAQPSPSRVPSNRQHVNFIGIVDGALHVMELRCSEGPGWQWNDLTLQLWEAAESLREGMETPLPPVWRTDYGSVAATSAQSGEKTFAAARAQGRDITPEQALAAGRPVILPAPSPAEPSSNTPTRKVVSYPDDLTARQVEVLRLLAQGLTNPQIAKRLGITAQTVHAHLRSMYSKLGVTTRSAATRCALEHRLV